MPPFTRCINHFRPAGTLTAIFSLGLHLSAGAADAGLIRGVVLTLPYENGRKLELGCDTGLAQMDLTLQMVWGAFGAAPGRGYLFNLRELFDDEIPPAFLAEIPELTTFKNTLELGGVSQAYVEATTYLARHNKREDIFVLLTTARANPRATPISIGFPSYLPDLILYNDLYSQGQREVFLRHWTRQGEKPYALLVLDRTAMRGYPIPPDLLFLNLILKAADFLRISERAALGAIEIPTLPRLNINLGTSTEVLLHSYFNFFTALRAQHAELKTLQMRSAIPPNYLRQSLQSLVQQVERFHGKSSAPSPLTSSGLLQNGVISLKRFDELALLFQQWIRQAPGH